MDGLLPWIVGPFGGLVLAVAGLWVLVFTEKLAPDHVVKALREQVATLEAERREQNQTYIESVRLAAGLAEEVKGLRRQVEALQTDIRVLRAKYGDD